MLPAHLNAACSCVCVLARSHVAHRRLAAALGRKLSQQRGRDEESARTRTRDIDRERALACSALLLHATTHTRTETASERDVSDARQL